MTSHDVDEFLAEEREWNREHPGQNKCGVCGRFRAWEDLHLEELYSMDLHGNVSVDDWMECSRCSKKGPTE